jgi:hypothetical protein
MGYRRATHVAWRQVGDETVLLDLHRNRIFGLNAPGGTLWAALHERGDAIQRLEGAPGESARAFLAELAAAGLVEESTTPLTVVTDCQPPSLPEGARPAIAWQEGLELIAASCALHSAQPLCDPQPSG